MDRIVIVVLEGEIFYAGPVLVIELESLSSQSSFSPCVIDIHDIGVLGCAGIETEYLWSKHGPSSEHWKM
ncbi:hypothetical protein DIPPA_28305 [Diplonema papillatum]|nr:hypothetical protein DIPPA_28305 [Diplonema papillatum]